MRRLTPLLVLLAGCPTTEPDPEPTPAPRAPYDAEHCAYFLTGEVDLEGTDADGDGIANTWDHCPNNPENWLDSDRDGIGNNHDDDLDGDGIPNADDPDRDGDGASNDDEAAASTDPDDPSMVPGLPVYDGDPGVFDPTPGWYLGDLHVHTEYSHDSTVPVADWADAAVGGGLDFVWITDHRTFQAPFDPAFEDDRVLLVPAIEWGGGGHAGMGGVRTNNEANYDDPADVLRAWTLARLQGGVQSLNHYGDDINYWDTLLAAEPALKAMLDVVEVWNTWWPVSQGMNEDSIDFWEGLLAEGYRIGAVGGSDVHYLGLAIGFPTTVVWADSLSIPGINAGLRTGRSFVTQSFPYRDGEIFSYEALPMLDFRGDADGDGTFEAMLGDTVAAGPVDFQLSVRFAHGPVVLFRDGVEIARFDDHAPGADIAPIVTDDAPPGSWYRVEMRETAEPDSAMLLLSSPIYVD